MAFFDLPSDPTPARKRAPRKKAAKKAAPKKAKAKKVSGPKGRRRLPTAKGPKSTFKKYEKPDESGSCLRSPCRPWDDASWFMDPKVGLSSVEAAMTDVRRGSPKLRQSLEVKTVGYETEVRDGEEIQIAIKEAFYTDYKGRKAAHIPGEGKWPLSVACGLGVDSVAILVGLAQLYRETGDKCWRPGSITFADTGGEHHQTYDLLPKLNHWLKKVGFPQVTVTAYSSKNIGAANWGTGVTLELDCISKHTLPSIAYPKASHHCSLKYKIEAQEPWIMGQIEEGKIRIPARGSLVRAIGYDATESKRLLKASTYSSSDEESKGFKAWYPLIEWGWDRSRCIAEIIREFSGSFKISPRTVKVVPRKSSCFFCSAMKPFEIAALPKDLLKRALFMEQVAIHGRYGLKTISGLGGGWSWTDFSLGKMPKGAYTRQAVINGRVWKQITNGPREGLWIVDYYGSPKAKLKENQYHEPGVGPLLTKSEVDRVIAAAKAWVRVTKKIPKSVGLDSACLKATRNIPAYTHILGFRGDKSVKFDRLRDEILPELEDEAAELRSRSHRPGTKAEAARVEKLGVVELMLDCLPALIRSGVRNRRVRKNPRDLPARVPLNVLLLGGTQE